MSDRMEEIWYEEPEKGTQGYVIWPHGKNCQCGHSIQVLQFTNFPEHIQIMFSSSNGLLSRHGTEEFAQGLLRATELARQLEDAARMGLAGPRQEFEHDLSKGCPDCGERVFHSGPRGGAGQNVECSTCHHRFNVVVHDSFPPIAQRIPNTGPWPAVSTGPDIRFDQKPA